MNKGRKIIVELNERDSFRSKIMDIEKEDQWFYPVFQKAKDIVSLLMKENENSQKEAEDDIYYYANNMIAFCGGRGQGKTSAMISFAKALSTLNQKEKAEQFFQNTPYKTTSANFYPLRPIDPTTLESGDSVLKTIISRMFQIIKNEKPKNISDGWERTQETQLQELLEKFETFFSNIDILIKGKPKDIYASNLDKLSELGDSSNLKMQFFQLVKVFLKYMFPNESQSGYQFLVIQVDDADMNFSQAYRIMEELRKYAMIPNVILLISTNLEQLSQGVEQHFLSEYKVQYDLNEDFDKNHCHHLAENYMEKILPSNHQIHLPSIDEQMQNRLSEIHIHYSRNRQMENTVYSYSGEYESVLIDLIRRKTSILLLPVSGGIHHFLPKTLRELCHFIDVLKDLPEVLSNDEILPLHSVDELYHFLLLGVNAENDNVERKKRLISYLNGNLNVLMEYFLNEWTSVHLTMKQKLFLQKLHNTPRYHKKSYLIEKITKHFREFSPELEKTSAVETEYWQLKEELEDYTLADVRFLLERMKDFHCDGDKYQFIYALHLYFTIYCHVLFVHDLNIVLNSPQKLENPEDFRELKKSTEEAPKEQVLIPFFNGAEFPWERLPVQKLEYLRYGGFEVDREKLRELIHGPQTENTGFDTLVETCLRKKLKKEDGSETKSIYYTFDPINASNLFPSLGLDNIIPFYGKDKEKNSDFLFCILGINLNWDLQKKVISELSTYQKNPYEKLKESTTSNTKPKTDNQFILPHKHQQYFYTILNNIYSKAIGKKKPAHFFNCDIEKGYLFNVIYSNSENYIKNCLCYYIKSIPKFLLVSPLTITEESLYPLTFLKKYLEEEDHTLIDLYIRTVNLVSKYNDLVHRNALSVKNLKNLFDSTTVSSFNSDLDEITKERSKILAELDFLEYKSLTSSKNPNDTTIIHTKNKKNKK